MKVRITPKAHKDILDIHHYIEQKGYPETANKQLDRIYDSMKFLEENPYMGRELETLIGDKTEYRMLIIKPYIEFYMVEDYCVEIVRVLDGRQDYFKILEIE